MDGWVDGWMDDGCGLGSEGMGLRCEGVRYERDVEM